MELPKSQDRLSCNQDDAIYEEDDPLDPDFFPDSEDWSSQSQSPGLGSQSSFELSYVCNIKALIY